MPFILDNFLNSAPLKNTLIFSLISLSVLSGCSSRSDVKITEVFRSNILDDNAKMFTFSLVFSYKNTAQNNEDVGEQQKQDNAKGKKRGKGKRGEKNKQQDSKSSSKSNKQETQMTEELETRLAERLEVNGYCRKGFFELKRTLNKSVYTIHGECSENATAIDRKNFINKVE